MRRSFIAFGLATILAGTAAAQLATTTALVGTVTDPSGKSVAGAKVTAVENGTRDTYTANTNEQGYYSIEFVRVGTYSVTVEQSGFQKVTKTGIVVDINQSVRTDVELPVGALTQSVTVQAEVAAIKTDDATVSEVLSTRNVADLPLNGRDPDELALTTPGVILGLKTSTTGTPPGEDFNGAGTREIQNEMSLDGISIMNNLITDYAHTADGGIDPGGGGPDRHLLGSIRRVSGRPHQHGHEVRDQRSPWRAGGIPPQPGSGRAHILHLADAREPDGGEASAAAEPVRLRTGWAGHHSEAVQRQGQDLLHVVIRRLPRWCSRRPSLSTEMPAAFFTGNFSSVPLEHHRRRLKIR